MVLVFQRCEFCVQSLSNRNRELLEENTGLYQQVKSGIARLAQEKEDLSRTYAKKLEQEIQRRSAGGESK